MQDSAAALVCFLVEYFETAMEAPPVTEDGFLMHRLLHNANNVKVHILSQHHCLAAYDQQHLLLQKGMSPH